ncbi:hypothetical protein B0H34DRAFT_670727 [Crassisporium funariophilum]|nr:hypothetical protein B0H34DRAFT_670727 [Crassisporium funariophilum]
MPPGQQSSEDKIIKTVKAIKKCGWRTTNKFVKGFYNSSQAAQSLCYQPKTDYGPKHILTAWMSKAPSSNAKAHLNLVVTQKAAEIMVKESTKACHNKDLCLSALGINAEHINSEFGLQKIKKTYDTLLPCLTLLLSTLLTAQNNYERKNDTEKIGKHDMAAKVVVVIISILLFFRNRATNAFQVMMGVFLSSLGVSRRVIDTFNHMGLSVNYHVRNLRTVQTSLQNLSEDAKNRAQSFVKKSKRCWAVVYDNRLNSATQQINATTSAVFSLPASFSRKAYAAALSIAEKNKFAGLRQLLNIDSLRPGKERHEQAAAAFKHAIQTIILNNCPGKMRHCQPAKALPLNKEEASVSGTIRVVEKIFTELLGLAMEMIEVELRLLVGDWLTIRNLRLMKDERWDEFKSFLRFDWVQEAAMPFHFQLNVMYMLCETHLGTVSLSKPESNYIRDAP